MAVEITNLIAAISPDTYCEGSAKSEVKKIAKEKGYLEAAKKARFKASSYINFQDVKFENAMGLAGLKAPVEEHKLVYDNFGEGAERIYFWLLDQATGRHKKVTKLIDNFVSSPGSTHFSEMGTKKSVMQDNASKWLGTAGQMMRSILNLVFDLKEFRTRLAVYDKLKSKNKHEVEGAILSLKQIWLDQVDIKRGNSSVKALAVSGANAPNFVTLLDAFMAVKDEKLMVNGNEIDLNDRVKRLLKQRISEFNIWINQSEKELRNREKVERRYLKTQVANIRLYAKWAKPYLKNAQALEFQDSKDPSLVNAFNTSTFQVSLLAEAPYSPGGDVDSGDLPAVFKKIKTRTYNQLFLLDFKFRASPERSQQGYGFRGKTEITFRGVALNNEELEALKKEIEKDDLKDVMTMIGNSTDDTLDLIADDLDEFLKDDEPSSDESKEKKKESEDINPFAALLDPIKGLFKPQKKKEEKKKKSSSIEPDSEYEKVLRSQAIIGARSSCYSIYDLYKKVNGMASLPGYA